MGIYSTNSLAGVTANTAKTTKQVLNGEATIKDVKNREVGKLKNTAKTIAKGTVAATALSTASIPLAATLLDIDVVSKLPKFLQKGISKFQNTPAVKTFASNAGEILETGFSVMATAAKKHPFAALGCFAISTASSIIGYNLIKNHGKEEGKIEQRYDDIVEIRSKQAKENPLA